VTLPLNPPLLPMLAKRVAEVPPGDGWTFEPKWDGFRAIIFRDGEEIFIQSRDGKSLNRYFPEVVTTLLEQLPERCVVDGEIVIAAQGRLDFDALQLRVHPAASRVKLLSEQTPASVVLFDLMCLGDEDLTEQPTSLRVEKLTEILRDAKPPLYQTPSTQDRAVATDWFKRFEGAGLDGVMAKALAGSYQPDKRTMLKVKHERDCDCVVAGFRWYKEAEGTAVGSLLLGLYDASGSLQHVGICASFTMPKRRELVAFLEPYREGAAAGHPWGGWGEESDQRMPGAASRWNSGKDLSWVALRTELVVEVAYEHMQGDRFRHMAQFRRWRTDKKPTDCTYAQLEIVAPEELKTVFAGAGI
jgi:ATP-dependent DNA ligase